MDRITQFLFLLASALTLASCATLSPQPEKTASEALPPAQAGALAATSETVSEKFGSDQSGFHLIPRAKDALNWRLALLDHATTSIDIQYYIWDADDAGRLMFSHLLDAAERGVRVRLLIDDFKFAWNDENLAALSHHPNIEVRLFNPQFVRAGFIRPTLEFAFRFTELNRRMHNKVFVVDNRMAIMGGRNIGDVYFGLGQDYNFIDLDVLTAGPVVEDISEAFDEFWNSDPTYPGEGISPQTGPETTEAAVASFRADFSANPGILSTMDFPLERSDWSEELSALKDQWHPGTARMVQDAPVTKSGVKRRRLLDKAPALMDEIDPQEIIFVSPYLVPRSKLLDTIARRSGDNARVRLLTPGLASNDLPLVHSHFKKHRRALMRSGAELFELRADPSNAIREYTDTHPNKAATVSLHLKGGVGDRKRCFIGSLNLDPRSIEINTEGGLFIESPPLAEELADHFEKLLGTENSWTVTSDKEAGKGQLRWKSREEELTIQPAKNFPSRISDFIFGLLPIEGLL